MLPGIVKRIESDDETVVASEADPGISERGGGGGVVHYRSNLEHQWCGRRVTAPASGVIS